jgi:hypothetical protein
VDAKLAALEQRLAAAVPAAPPAGDAPAPAPRPAPAPAPAARICKVPGCTNKVRARGFCARHYQQWRRGTLEGFPNPDA